jgi:hypothetical protein
MMVGCPEDGAIRMALSPSKIMFALGLHRIDATERALRWFETLLANARSTGH